VPLVEEFNAKTLVLGAGNWLTIVVIDVEVLAGINQSKVFRTLDDGVDTVFDIKKLW